ncbi:MAG TPA: hypothetical protein QGI71_12530 [Dehalococcoidia bacterium]|nr:hypothetical protein [Dehalococcoidia bacterium]
MLIVAHHGSKSSSTRQFLDAVQPSVAVIAVGESNRYDHPNAEVLARFDGGAVLLFRTDLDGDVALLSDGKRLWVNGSR